MEDQFVSFSMNDNIIPNSTENNTLTAKQIRKLFNITF